ncbi:uncharacterized protein FPRN_00305 [Fusarium proliferatum]|nr:uncharacterized protein FPRN_00305 [Fusarium proliferatum]
MAQVEHTNLRETSAWHPEKRPRELEDSETYQPHPLLCLETYYTSAVAKGGGPDDDFEEGVDARDNQSLTKTSPGEALPNTEWDLRCMQPDHGRNTGLPQPALTIQVHSLLVRIWYSRRFGLSETRQHGIDNTVSTTKDVQSHLRMFGIDGLGAKYGWLRERHELSVTVTKVVKERLEKPTAEVNGLDSSKIFLSALNNDLSIRNAALSEKSKQLQYGCLGGSLHQGLPADTAK